MRASSLLLLLTLGVGCGGACAPKPPAAEPAVSPAMLPAMLPAVSPAVSPAPLALAPPARTADPADTRALYDALPLPDSFAAWQPSPGELLAAMRVGTEEGDQALAAMTPEFQVSVLRAGLRLPPSRASWACARSLGWRHRDVAEQRMSVLHIVNAVLDPTIFTDTGEFWSLLECFGAADIPLIHEWMRGADPVEMRTASDMLLHKVTHGEQLGLVADFLIAEGVPDPAVDDRIWLVCEFTDQHREAVARCFVGDAAIEAERSARPGLPPALRASLLRLLDPGDLYAGAVKRYGWWASRWLRDAVPSEADAPLLLRLDQQYVCARSAVWSMRHLTDAGVLERLRERAEQFDEPDPTQSAARAALALRGDAAALDALSEECTIDGTALALLLEIRPALALQRVGAILCDPGAEWVGAAGAAGAENDLDDLDDLEDFDESALEACLNAIREAHEEARLDLGLTWTASVFAPLTDAVLAAPISAGRLNWTANAIPALWTQRVADAVAARLGDAPPAREIENDEWTTWGQYALLEVAAPDALRARLRLWARDERPRVGGVALALLLRMGDPESGALLVEGFRSGNPSLFDDEDIGLQHLALSDDPAVRAYLREVASAVPQDERQAALRVEAAAGLALLHGLPTALLDAGDFWQTDADDAGIIDGFCSLALAERGIDAYVHLLERAPDEQFWGAGDVADPRVTAYLQRLRRERHLEQYAFATAELAIQGDTAARAEQWTALSRGLYRWCDDMNARFATIGFDMGLVPHWAEFLEASDCQEPTARVLLDELFDLDLDYGGRDGHTPAQSFSAWRADRPGALVRSRLAGDAYFVPRPR